MCFVCVTECPLVDNGHFALHSVSSGALYTLYSKLYFNL